MNNWQDYYFQQSSKVLFVDEENEKVGILNETPAFTLDVNGDISGSNVISINTIADYIEASNAYIDNVGAIRISATSNVTAQHIQASSNLKILNTYVNNQCPIPQQGSLFGFSLGGGWIHPSWLKTEDDFAETLNSLWNLAQTGWDIASFASEVLDPSNTLGQGLKDAINKALSNGTLRVPWASVNYKPIYGSATNTLGFDGDVYMNDKKSLYSLPSYQLSTVTNDGFNVDIISTTGAIKILDLETKEAYLKLLSASNVASSNGTIRNFSTFYMYGSNLSCSNVSASNYTAWSNIQTPVIIASDKIQIGSFCLTPSGLYLGDPIVNPFGAVQVLDNVGNYKGTIDKNQITNLEAFNIKAAADGSLIWGEFGNTTAINDVFATQNPLYNV